MSSQDHEYLRELVFLASLNALEKDEKEVVDAHLKVCSQCQEEMKELEEIAAALGENLDPVSVDLWPNILKRLKKERSYEFDRLNNKGYKERSLDWLKVALVALLGACFVAIGILGITVSDLNAKVASLSNAAKNNSFSALAEDALVNPRLKKVFLYSDNVPYAEMVMMPNGEAFLFNLKLKPVAPSETYQAWAVGEKYVISLGVLGNSFRVVVLSMGQVSAYSKVALTVEQSGGVVQSRKQPVCIGNI